MAAIGSFTRNGHDHFQGTINTLSLDTMVRFLATPGTDNDKASTLWVLREQNQSSSGRLGPKALRRGCARVPLGQAP